MDIEGVSGNFCCLIEEKQLFLLNFLGFVLGCFFDLGFVAFADCVWIRHRKS